jgi:transcriptional regulator with XRE-family HTH domain
MREMVSVLDAISILVEYSSIMVDELNLDQRIGARVRDLRTARGLTLEVLAERSGVSRSMISVIERGESSATAALLEKLAAGLGVSLASLFDAPTPSREPVARRAEQPQWRDPASGYIRRNVSPAGVASPIQIVEVEFPAGARVAFDSGARDMRVHQQVWVLDGAIEVSVGDERHQLRTGDCLAFVLDRPTAFRNRTRKTVRYAVVIMGQPESPR